MYLLYFSLLTYLTGMINILCSFPDRYTPWIWLVLYIIAVSIHLRGGKIIYIVTDILALISLLLLIIYYTATIPQMNFQKYVTPSTRGTNPFSSGGINGFLLNFPVSTWFYIGIETVPLLGSETGNPKRNIPKAMLLSLTTAIILTFATLFSCASQYPGFLIFNSNDGNNISLSYLPLSYGYSQVLNITSIFSLPGLFLGFYICLFPFSKQMAGAAQSGYLPIQFTYKLGQNDVPYVALIFGSLVGYIVMVFFWFFSPNAFSILQNSCSLATFVVYIACFISYIGFATKYDDLKRPFRNPFGIYGAVLGIVIFSLLIVSVAIFQQDDYYALITFVGYIFVMIVYYFAVVSKRQCFSPEEQKIMFKIYVRKSN